MAVSDSDQKLIHSLVHMLLASTGVFVPEVRYATAILFNDFALER